MASWLSLCPQLSEELFPRLSSPRAGTARESLKKSPISFTDVALTEFLLHEGGIGKFLNTIKS